MNVRMLASRVAQVQPQQERQAGAARKPDQSAAQFANELLDAQLNLDGVRLSAHAESRIEERGIAFSMDDRARISDAMRALEEKGARNALLLRGESAFLVSIPNKTIITAMDATDLSERAFTNIDSAYLLSTTT